MSNVIIPTRFQWRRDTAANWTSNNPTLRAGEPGLETDTGYMKVGDGSTAWNDLDYGPNVYPVLKAILTAGTNVTITPDDGAKTLTIAASGGGGIVVAKDFYSSNEQETLSKTLSWQPTHTLVPSDFAQTTKFVHDYTPQGVGNRLRVRCGINYVGTSINSSLRVGLIAGSSVIAGRNLTGANNYPSTVLCADFEVVSLDTITLKLGFASAGSTSIYVQGGSDGSVFFNGASPLTLEIEEYVP